ncbi:stage VI sporulation protein D [Bacillus sp. V59.32b]|uniref:stage VI sporulation protein D n=1 Tax=Bacillus sp. V59.32b TaxID=1758642 RepID=UPI0013591CA1|nr:stage VI sporulation protein D [Bacillus sp. V59.32b]
MSKENQSYLRFSLEEAVWFQKGQEVAELYSISLDPNITIQERDQYVVIKGTLDLSGEYKEEQRSGESEPKNYIQNYHPKTIQEVNRGENDVNVFTHCFPVDITIPYNRIHSIDDVDVEIQTFDYTLPEKNCLKLQADLLITGIYKEQQTDITEKEEEIAREHEYEISEEKPEEVHFRVYPVPQENEDEHMGSPRIVHEKEDSGPIPYINEEAFEEQVRDSSMEEEEDYPAEQPVRETNDEDLYAPFFAEAKKLPEDERVEDIEPVAQSVPIFEIPVEPLQEESEKENREPETLHPMTDIEQESEEDVEAEQERYSHIEQEQNAEVQEHNDYAPILNLARKKDKSAASENEEKERKHEKDAEQVSLMDFFGRKQEEELTKVKVCIVQQGDTLSTLADRYDISVQSIQSRNSLDPGHDVYEGQVLYIPKTAKAKV